MSGTMIGGSKAAKTNKSKNPNFYREIGAIGGKRGAKDGAIKGFAAMPREKRVEAGRRGGSISSRKKND